MSSAVRRVSRLLSVFNSSGCRSLSRAHIQWPAPSTHSTHTTCRYSSVFNSVSDTHQSSMFSSTTAVESSASREARTSGITSNVVSLDGTKIHYEVTGTGNHVILLLPGALGSTRTDFSHQLENLNKDIFTVIAWDPPGYGRSYPPDRQWPAKFLHRDADIAAQLMETLGYKSYSLLGWSDGGITGLILAANHPDRVRKLVVWGANAYITDDESKGYNAMRDISAWSERMKKPFIDLYGEEYFRTAWAGWVDNFVSKYYNDCAGDICKGELTKIQCPTLIVHGEKDAMVPQFHADYLRDNIKGSRLKNMPEGKHNLHMRFYQEFNSLVEGFLVEL